MTPSSSKSAERALTLLDSQETVALAQALIRIPSITGHEGTSVAEFIAEWFRERDISAELQPVDGGRANVVAWIGEDHGPRLLLNGHLDTKPYDNMTIEPTAASIHGGRLYGRGSCDMKAALAAFMAAMAAIEQTGAKLHGRLLFGSEVGEEGGGWRLTNLLDGPGRADAMICGEPTNLELHIGNRGWFQMNVTTRGIATHSGMAYTGVNAIEKMAKVVTEIYRLPCFHHSDPIWGRSPVNVQFIHGGGKVSGAVADDCQAHFDIRLNPDLPPEALARDLDLLLDAMRASDPELDVEWRYRPDWPKDLLAHAPAVHLPADHPFVGSLAKAYRMATGQEVRFGGFPGGCAAGICLERGIPAVVIGPGSLAQAHSADEWVEVEQIGVAAQIYTLAALSYLGAKD